MNYKYFDYQKEIVSTNTDELKKFLEAKIAELKKELEYYEYLYSILEAEGYKSIIKGNKGTADVIKNSRGEIIAEIYYTPPLMRILFKGKIIMKKTYSNVINRMLEIEKNRSKIEYEVSLDKDELREIIINNVKDELTYNKIKAGLQSILERISL
jgi:hypothetical protein